MSRKLNGSSLQKKYHHLRSLTNSNSEDKLSIIKDASNYIKELKQKVQRLNNELGPSSSNYSSNPLNTGDNVDDQISPQVTVEVQEKNLVINVYLEESCPGLLVNVLQTFDDLRLEVHDANVSSDDCFQLEALVEAKGVDNLDAEIVREAVLQAIINWKATT